MDVFFIRVILLAVIADVTCAKIHTQILSKHHKSIENYIMIGYEKKSEYQCDVLSDDPRGQEGKAQFVMDSESIEHFDVASNLVSSDCMVVSVEVNNNQSLAAVVKFGWTILQHKRVAILIEMGSGLTLNMATNITKLPFVVAAQLQNGKEQFLCPIFGEVEPRLQDSMCDPAYASYKKKVIRVGIIGVAPYFYGKIKIAISKKKVLKGF